ncbi:PLC-like phosphodiesterase [Gorgonomyces haynaldii]|nr:PLC-like phosphodiesterase [Gorgonomyces haynaldii]
MSRDNWLSNHPTKKLHQLILPGTHNSGTYLIRSENSLGVPFPVSFVVKLFARPFAQCQNRTIAEQLQMGIRYLDLRLVQRKQLVVNHEFDACSMEAVLTDIVGFLKTNKTEIVFVKAKAAHNSKGPEPIEWSKVRDVLEPIQELLVPPEGMQWTVQECLERGKRLVWMNDGHQPHLPHLVPQVWGKQMVRDQWFDQPTPAAQLQKCLESLAQPRECDRFVIVGDNCTARITAKSFVLGFLDHCLPLKLKPENACLRSNALECHRLFEASFITKAPNYQVFVMDYPTDALVDAIIRLNST